MLVCFISDSEALSQYIAKKGGGEAGGGTACRGILYHRVGQIKRNFAYSII